MAKTGSSKGKSKKLRYAVIGAGGIAGAHMGPLSQRDDIEFVALADPFPGKKKQYAEQYKIPASGLYEDYQKMLKEVQPDAVSVCSPNGMHAENTIAALQAGADVIVEKPMAATVKQAQDMVDLAKKLKRKLVIGFQYRYSPRVSFLKNAIDAGQFGNVLFGRVQALRRRGIPNWGVFGRKDVQGGGGLIDIGVHALEMCHYTMGSPKPVAATGATWTYLGNKPSNKIQSQWSGWDYKTYTVEDLAIGSIRFDNGAVVHIEAGFAAHIEKGVWNFQLMGEKGGGNYDPCIINRDDIGHMVDTRPNWMKPDGFGDMFGYKMNAFVEHVLHNTPTIAPAEAGLAVQKMLEGIYQSAESGGREVAIK
jgi:predicted dehydrogenase